MNWMLSGEFKRHAGSTHLLAHRKFAFFWYFLTGWKTKKPVNIEYLQALIRKESQLVGTTRLPPGGSAVLGDLLALHVTQEASSRLRRNGFVRLSA